MKRRFDEPQPKFRGKRGRVKGCHEDEHGRVMVEEEKGKKEEEVKGGQDQDQARMIGILRKCTRKSSAATFSIR